MGNCQKCKTEYFLADKIVLDYSISNKKELEDVFKIAVCEDQVEEQDKIKRMIEHYCTYKVLIDVKVYSSGEALLQELDRNFDVIFLDIQMPGISGLETAATIRKTGSDVMLIFLTGYDDFALQGYEVQAFRFLLKPIQKEVFEEHMEKILENLFKSRKKAIIKTKTATHFMELNKIHYLEKEEHKVKIVTDEGDLYSMASMRHWSEYLKDKDFSLCHGSILINLNHVASYDRRDVFLDSGVILKMSQQRYLNFHQQMMCFGRSI